MGKRMGAPVHWDPDPNPGAQQAQQAPEPPAPKYTEEQVQARLKGQSKELEKLQAQLAELNNSKAAAEKAAAEKNGEFEKLYRESQENAKALEGETKAERERRERYEAHLKSEIEGRVSKIEDKAQREKLLKALDGLDPLKQHELLAAFSEMQPAQSQQPVTARPGAAGAPKVNRQVLLNQPGKAGEDARRAAIHAEYQRRTGKALT